MSFTIGSLFDGSGGFPLAAFECGGVPLWASEVEPYPIAVTKSRFPHMKHLGDVTKIKGDEVDPVDVLSFGFPCQDVSVAGCRKGVRHEENGDEETTRSGLFHEAVRIIKEMRHATNGRYPTFAIFENVPGLLSSSRGEDFRIVLEELIKIVEPDAVMPGVPKNGWPYADCYCGEGWSLGYRIFDAQYLRTAQRRRRIYALIDFRGQRAKEILFERESLRGYFEEGRTSWKDDPTYAERSPGADDREGACVGFHLTQDPITSENCTPCISSGNPVVGQASVGVCHKTDDREPKTCGFPLGFRPENVRLYDETATTLCNGTRAGFCNGVVSVVPGVCFKADDGSTGDVSPTLVGDHNNRVTDHTAIIVETVALEGNGQRPSHHGDGYIVSDKSYTLNTTEVHGVVYAMDRTSFNQDQNAQYDFEITDSGVNSTLVAKGPSAVAYDIGNDQVHDAMSPSREVCKTLNCMDDPMKVCVVDPPRYIVRRLTPTECARLQGFPDFWGHPDKKTELTEEDYRFWLDVRQTHDRINGRKYKDYTEQQILAWYNKLHTDSSEYKMWGNGIALPCAIYVMQGVEDAFK